MPADTRCIVIVSSGVPGAGRTTRPNPVRNFRVGRRVAA